ncbi:SAM-dependent methyltransferase [Candidatus Woesebacteria bacterium]|nr:SAM-dependent methyltransferase [Candidatus Woesebacteria bacterium]
MKKFLRLFKKTFPRFVLATFILEVEKHLEGCKTILDVGCGDNSPIGLFEKKYTTVGIDGHKPAIEHSKKRKIHNNYTLGDIRKLDSLVKKKSFDAVMALDVIEHLKKDDGHKLLDNMEKAARKKVILVTPNGFIPQYDKKNKLQAHLSGWTVEDFTNRGYRVEGIYGTKFCNILRTNEAELKWKPRLFWALVWGILAETTHYLYTRKNPKYSIGLLAVKKVK